MTTDILTEKPKQSSKTNRKSASQKAPKPAPAPASVVEIKRPESSILDEVTKNQQRYIEWFNSRGFYHAFVSGKERIIRMVPDHNASTSKADRTPMKLDFLERSAFINRYASMAAVPASIDPETGKVKRVSPAKIWLSGQDRALIDGFCFNPEENPLTVNKFNQFNLYQGRAVNPANCSYDESREFLAPYLTHLYTQVCDSDKDNYQAFINVCAAKYQNPTIKPFCTIIHGIEGTGKDTAVEPFRRLYGAHGKKATKAEQVLGTYNAGTLSGALFLWMDEAFAGTKDATDIMKTVVFTDELWLSDKFVPQWLERVLNQTMLTTNRENMIRFATHDRRYFVLKMSDAMVGNKGYFDDLWALINHPLFLKHLANFLLRIDTTGFNYRKPPVTKSMAMQKLSTAEPDEKFIHKIILDRGIRPLIRDGYQEGETPIIEWPEKMASKDITQLFEHWLRDTRTPFAKDPSMALGDTLPKYGFTKKKGRYNGQSVQGWLFPTLEDAKTAMIDVLGADISDEIDM